MKRWFLVQLACRCDATAPCGYHPAAGPRFMDAQGRPVPETEAAHLDSAALAEDFVHCWFEQGRCDRPLEQQALNVAVREQADGGVPVERVVFDSQVVRTVLQVCRHLR